MLRGNGTVVLPHGGHGVGEDDTCVRRRRRRMRKNLAGERGLWCMFIEIGRAHV